MRIVANGLSIEIEDQGPPGGEPLLLIMGLGMQLTAWPQELVQLLVSRGFRVLRMDNRDAGLSQGFEHAGMPNLAWAGIRYAVHLPVRAPYGIADMALDALGVLDALGLPQAHVCGASLGGMVAQHLAARHPQRVKSLTLLMSSSGARHLPQPSLRVRRVLLSRPGGHDVAALAAHLRHVFLVIGSPGFAADPKQLDAGLQAMIRRAWRPSGTARQLLAVLADGDRSALLPMIQAPTQVIHGQADPLIPVAAGAHLAAHIAGARLDIVPGMGHDLPLQLLPRLAEGIVAAAARAV